jgi:HEAT repeat protein
MFGLNLDTIEWAAAIGVAYLVLRLAYGVGRVIWWYTTDSLRICKPHILITTFTGFAVAAMCIGLVSLATDIKPGVLHTVVYAVAAVIGFFIGVIFDFIIEFRLYRISTWLMSFRVPQYREQLLDGDEAVRLGAARRLVGLGGYAIPARPELFGAFKDKSADVRAAAVQAISNTITDPPAEDDTETPTTTRAVLTDPDIRVRVYAAGILSVFNAATPAEVLPTLCEALSLADNDTAYAAAFVLYRMGPAAEPAIASLRDSVLLRALPNAAAVDALGKIGAPAVPALVEILERGDVTSKWQAASSLGTMGDAAREALPALRKAAALPNTVLSSAAKRAIAKLGG